MIEQVSAGFPSDAHTRYAGNRVRVTAKPTGKGRAALAGSRALNHRSDRVREPKASSHAARGRDAAVNHGRDPFQNQSKDRVGDFWTAAGAVFGG